uniref:SH3 domain-containing protein n=1 Tax=Globodera pallida TaxID=36090 RepID=A0A183BK42_GLOPA
MALKSGTLSQDTPMFEKRGKAPPYVNLEPPSSSESLREGKRRSPHKIITLFAFASNCPPGTSADGAGGPIDGKEKPNRGYESLATTSSADGVRFRQHPPEQCVGMAVFDYEAREQDELTLKRGSMMKIVEEECGEEGWALARMGWERDGTRVGKVPKHYVALLGSQPEIVEKGSVWRSDDFLGAGSYAEVFRGTFKGKQVALKLPRAENGEALKREALILSRLRHENIVQFFGISPEPLFIHQQQSRSSADETNLLPPPVPRRACCRSYPWCSKLGLPKATKSAKSNPELKNLGILCPKSGGKVSRSSDSAAGKPLSANELAELLSVQPVPVDGSIANPSYVPMQENENGAKLLASTTKVIHSAPPRQFQAESSKRPVPKPRTAKADDLAQCPTSQAPMLNRAEIATASNYSQNAFKDFSMPVSEQCRPNTLRLAPSGRHSDATNVSAVGESSGCDSGMCASSSNEGASANIEKSLSDLPTFAGKLSADARPNKKWLRNAFPQCAERFADRRVHRRIPRPKFALNKWKCLQSLPSSASSSLYASL